ncbi:MAG: phage holin family protein [candidate division WOR-3 bacterium]
MMGLFLRFAVNVASLFLTDFLIPGFEINDPYSLILSAFLLGIMNSLVKPIVEILTLPLTILSLGLWSLILNALLFLALSLFVKGFHFESLGWGILSWIIYSIISAIISKLLS